MITTIKDLLKFSLPLTLPMRRRRLQLTVRGGASGCNLWMNLHLHSKWWHQAKRLKDILNGWMVLVVITHTWEIFPILTIAITKTTFSNSRLSLLQKHLVVIAFQGGALKALTENVNFWGFRLERQLYATCDIFTHYAVNKCYHFFQGYSKEATEILLPRDAIRMMHSRRILRIPYVRFRNLLS